MDGAEVKLTKAGPGGEQIVVTLNVNHSVDSAEPDDGQGEVSFAFRFLYSKNNKSDIE
jgi:hypothetical protein